MEPHVFEIWHFEGGGGGGGGGRGGRWREARGGHKFLFFTVQTFGQKLLFHVVAMSGLKRFRIVAHCYVVSFSIKTLFC